MTLYKEFDFKQNFSSGNTAFVKGDEKLEQIVRKRKERYLHDIWDGRDYLYYICILIPIFKTKVYNAW